MRDNRPRTPVPGRRYGACITATKLSADAVSSKLVATGLLQNALASPTSVIRLSTAAAIPGTATSYLDISGATAKFKGDLVAAGGTFSQVTAGLLVNQAASPTAAIRLDAGSAMPGTATFKIDLAASGSGAVLSHPGAELSADGNATFAGKVIIRSGATDIEFQDDTGAVGATISAGPTGTPWATDAGIVDFGLGAGCNLIVRRDPDPITLGQVVNLIVDFGTPSMSISFHDQGVSGVLMRVNGGFQHASGTLSFFGAIPTTRPVIIGTQGSATWYASIENALVTLGLASR